MASLFRDADPSEYVLVTENVTTVPQGFQTQVANGVGELPAPATFTFTLNDTTPVSQFGFFVPLGVAGFATRVFVEMRDLGGTALVQETIFPTTGRFRFEFNPPLENLIRTIIIRVGQISTPNQALTIENITIGVRDTQALMNSPGRRVHGRVEVTYLRPLEQEFDKVGVSNDTNPVMITQQAANNVEEPTYAWFALNNNLLDNTYHPVPLDRIAEFEFGWWSDRVSDSEGRFADPPVLEITFTPRLALTASVFGDALADNFPVDFTVELFEGMTLKDSITVTDNTLPFWNGQFDAVDVRGDRLVLTIQRHNKPGALARVVELGSTVRELYGSDQLFRINLLEELHFNDGQIPIGSVSANEITIVLDNSDNRFNPQNPNSQIAPEIKKNRRVRAWLGIEGTPGNITWYILGTFFSVNWDVDLRNRQTVLLARDRLELLRQTRYSSPVRENENLFQLFTDIFVDAGLNPNRYNVDPALNTIVFPFAWFGPVSHREALRTLALNSLVSVYVDRDDVIQVRDVTPPMDSSFTFSDSVNVINRRYPNARQDQVNVVEVVYNTYAYGSTIELLNFTGVTKVEVGETVEKLFQYLTDRANSNITVTNIPVGITTTVVAAYSWGAVLSFENTTGSPIDITQVTINGTQLETTSSVVQTVSDQQSIEEDGTVTQRFTPLLVQNATYAEELATAILQRFGLTANQIELNTRGHLSLPLGTRNTVEDAESGTSQDYSLVRQEINWRGSLQSTVTSNTIGG